MIKFKTFSMGAINVKNERKYDINLKKIELPEYILIPLELEGKKSVKYIKENDYVEENQLLSESFNPDYNAYSPLPGVVEKIYKANLPTLGLVESAIIKFTGNFKSLKANKKLNLKKPKELLNKIVEYSIPWRGSNSIKDYIGERENFDDILIPIISKNGFSKIEEILLNENLEEIERGIEILSNIFSSKNITFAVSNEEAKNKLEKIVKSENINVKIIPERYPYFNEHLLLYLVYNKALNCNKSASEEGILICELEDIYNVSNCLSKNIPFTEKIITINARDGEKSKILKAKLGTPLKQILNLANYENLKSKYKILINNPFWGREISDYHLPLTKDINTITIIEIESNKREYPCLNCLKCTNICPVGLEPIKLYNMAKNNDEEGLIENKIENCIECGLCSFICPSKIDLTSTIVNAKNNLKDKLKTREKKRESQKISKKTNIFYNVNFSNLYGFITLALMPSLLLSSFKNINFLFSTLVLISFSIAFYYMFKFKDLKLDYAIYNALLINLLLPVNLNIITKVIILITSLIILYSFQGISKYFINPIVLAIVICSISFQNQFIKTYKTELQYDLLPKWNKLNDKSSYEIYESESKNLTSKNNKFIEFIKNNIFEKINILIPNNYIEKIFGFNTEKNLSIFLLFISIAIIFRTYLSNSITIISFYISLSILIYLERILNENSIFQGDILTLISSPITFLSILLLASEAQTSPATNLEEFIYGLILSLIYFSLLQITPNESLTIMYAIFLSQLMSLIIREINLSLKIKRYTLSSIKNDVKNKEEENFIKV